MMTARIGIMPLEQYKKRTISIAKGEYKPAKNEPKIWFTSMKSLANLLSEDNQELLRTIIDKEPKSISELESITDRKVSNILRTLRKMEQYGIVELVNDSGDNRKPGKKPIVPKVLYNEFDIQCKIAF